MSEIKLNPKELVVLKALCAGDSVHYMPYAGRFCPNSYWFMSGTHRKCTKEVEKLRKLGFIKEETKVMGKSIGVVTEEGKAFFLTTAAPTVEIWYKIDFYVNLGGCQELKIIDKKNTYLVTDDARRVNLIDDHYVVSQSKDEAKKRVLELFEKRVSHAESQVRSAQRVLEETKEKLKTL